MRNEPVPDPSSDPVRLQDQEARELIVSCLDQNLVVEASAGSGKTESLARRMAAGVASGHYTVDGMAAVTFTRKAAAELRGRFQQTLESLFRAESDGTRKARIAEALRHLERFFAGTIHAFCAHLLRARPVEADVAPGFVELDEVSDAESRRRAWRDYLARERARGSRRLRELQNAGIQAADLDAAFERICLFEEVVFPPGEAAPPDPAPAWTALDRFWSTLGPRLPRTIASDTKCRVQQRGRECRWRLRAARRDRPSDLVVLLSLWEREVYLTQRWWSGATPDVRTLKREVDGLVAGFQADTVHPYLARWRHYVYRLAIDILVDAREFARIARFEALTLNYGDLLQRAAKLLREKPDVRSALQAKYRWLFVDEFQDTDPIQAEVITLLASNEATPPPDPVPGPAAWASDAPPARARPADWTAVTLRPGALFIVGDPKQSIYRFRRADIEIYDRVCDIVKRDRGLPVELTTSFRSVPEICEWANDVFQTVFPAEATPQQPAFHKLEPAPGGRPAASGERGVRTLTIPGSVEWSDVAATEAADIARYIRREIDAGRRSPGDFLILTWVKRRLGTYAEALERLQVPLEVSGAGAFGDSEYVAVLGDLLRALSDPDDGLALVGVLRGPLFGVSDEDLFRYRQAGGWFRLTMPPGPATSGVSAEAPPPRPPDAAGHEAPKRGQLSLLDVLAGSVSEDRDRAPARPTAVQPEPDPGAPRRPALEGAVASALRELQTYFRWTRRLPAAAAVERILEATGYLALAASDTPGGPDAGDLVHAVDRVRQVAERGGTLAETVASLAREVESTEVESLPLEPGRGDVVRVMNLHRAKGLEAPVVFLADPAGGWRKEPDIRIVRDGGRAVGYFQLTRRRGKAREVLGEPGGWDAHAAIERVFLDKEEDRLRYVAATRARDLLVVSRWERSGRNRPWGPFDFYLMSATHLDVPRQPFSPTHESVEVTGATRARAAARRAAGLAAATVPSWTAESVTGSLRHEVPVREDDPARLLRGPATGMEWGELVHKLLEHAIRTKRVDREALGRLARWLTLGRADLEGVVPEALAAVERVSGSEMWRDALAADACHVEVPFATLVEDPELGRRVLHGVIDLVYRTADGWRIVDHKTDQLVSTDGEELLGRHAAQIEIYEKAWARLSPAASITTGVHAVRAGVTHWRTPQGESP